MNLCGCVGCLLSLGDTDLDVLAQGMSRCSEDRSLQFSGRSDQQLDAGSSNKHMHIWVFPKIVGFPPNHPF